MSDDLSNNASSLYQRVEELQRRCASDPENALEVLSDALSELRMRLEELSAADDVPQSTLLRFYTVLSSMYASILLVSDDGRIEFANQTFCDFFGLKCSPAELTKLTSSELIEKIKDAYLHPDEEVIRIREIVERGQPVKSEEIAMRGGRTCLRDFIPIYVDGKSHGRLWHHLDITEHKRMDESLQEKQEELEEQAEELELQNEELRTKNEELNETTRKLQESEERLRFVLETCHVGAWDMDISDHTTIRSPEHDHIYGYDVMLPQWTYEMFLEHVVPEDRARVDATYQNAIRTQSNWSFEFRIRRPDGQVRWIWATGDHRRDADGAIRRVAGIVQDITDRKRTEEEIYSLAKFPEENPNPVLRIAADCTIVYANPSSARLLELWGCQTGQVMPDDFRNHIQETLRSGNNKEIEVLFGNTIYSLVLTPIANSGYVNVYGRDITDRKRTEEALRKSEERLVSDLAAMTCLQKVSTSFVQQGGLDSLLDEIMEIAIVLAGTDKGTLQLINPESKSLEIVAQRGFERSYIDFISSAPHGSAAVCATALRQQERVIVEDVTRSPIFIGTPALDMQLTAGVRAVQSTPLINRRGEMIGMLSTHWGKPGRPDERTLRFIDLLARQAADIIARKQAEEELRKAKDELELRVCERTAELSEAKENLETANEELKIENEEHLKLEEKLRTARDAAETAARAKTNFMANMSHEIRTPMNAVIGMTSILLDEPLTHEQKDYVETIRSSGNALLVIINDILDFSRLDREKAELEEQFFDLRALVEEALDQVALKAAEKGLNLAYIMARDVPETIYSDPARLRQVLLNLLNNAVKFTEKGEILVSVGQAPAGVRQEIRFSVQDTGIGIPQEHLEKIFEPFAQVDASLSRNYDGVGLGLAISKKLVEMMGGNFRVKSEPGKGSCFLFTIRARVRPGEPRKVPSGVQEPLKGRKVLVIEESKTNRMILGRLLHEWGVMPLPVSSANEALDYLTPCGGFDTLIVGSKLAEMDGFALAARLLETAKKIPVILLAPVGAKPAEGFTAALSLPIKPLQLYSTLISIFALALAQEKAIMAVQPETGPLKILLAEDSASSQKVTLQMLRRLGYRADLAANGHEAIEALKRQHYDLVLMDVKMPMVDGYDATREIRRLWPKNGPKIIALTAYALAGDRERCLGAGMDGYLAKPVVLEDLKRVLEDVQVK